MKTVRELTRNELNELKQSYYVQMMDDYPECVCSYSLATTDNIPDEDVFSFYDHVTFTDDDFFCN